MYTFDVLVWEDPLEDGSMGYGAWCTYLHGVWGQGDTEEEALQEIKLMMADVVNDPEDLAESLVNHEDAATEMARMMRERESEGIPYQVRQVSVTDSELAGV